MHALLLSAILLATTPTAAVERVEAGNRVSENIPPIPPELLEQLNRYQNTRAAAFAGWTKDGCILIATRFAETAQAHRVCAPLGVREQLTFYAEPISNLHAAPALSSLNGFVFGKDVGGNEFSQLYWFDFSTRAVTRLTDGNRNQNHTPLFSHDGQRMAWSSTARNGTDTDVWLMDMATREAKPLVTAGGSWSAQDFSDDGKRLLVTKYISAAESYPGEVDVASGELHMFPVNGGKASFGDFKFAPGTGRAAYFVSNEPIKGKPQEFHTLRYHDPASGKLQILSADIPWDVDQARVSDDGKHLGFTTNEDGIAHLHVLTLPDQRALKLPELPVGDIGNFDFAPDGNGSH